MDMRVLASRTFCDISSIARVRVRVRARVGVEVGVGVGVGVGVRSTAEYRAYGASSCDMQPNQLGRPARLYNKDPPFSHGIEHHSSRHLGFDGQGTVDADRRSVAHIHVTGKLVYARQQHDPVD